jgi:hypothetical protein
MVHRVPRYQVVAPVWYTAALPRGAREGKGWTRDLSETGACVELGERLPPATPLTLVLETEAGNATFLATVVWVTSAIAQDAANAHGLQFSPGSPGAIQLTAWLQRHPPATSRTVAALPARCRRLDNLGPRLEGWTADLGYGGCGLFLPERLPVGTLLEVALSTPFGEVAGEGVIVWEEPRRGTGPQLSEHGLRFTVPPTPGDASLKTLLDALVAGRAPTPGPESSEPSAG